MALQFVLGGSGSGKSEYVKNLAIRLATEDRKNNVLMIVPDQFTMQTQWQMANSHPDGGIINIDVLSFSRLPRKVFEEVGQPKRMLLDDTGKCLLIKRGASKIKDDLRVLSRGMENAGWAGEVKSVLSEFMQYNVSPEDLETIKEKCTSEALKNKLSDLKLLYEVFLKECEDKYITREELLDMFIERLPLSRKMEKSVVIFDGFTGFTPIQIKAIVAVLNKAKDVYITFPFDSDPNANPHKISENEDTLFNLTKRNMEDIAKEYDPTGVNIKDDIRLTKDYRHEKNAELAFLEKNLFRKENEKIKAEGAIKISRCADIDSECHILCEELLKEIREKNLRFRDVAVICADMTRYQKPLAKYLDRYQIPYYMDANRSIASNPLVKYILSIAEILRNNFREEDVLKFLRTGISPIEEDEIDELENYIYARGIKGIAKWREDFVYSSEEQRLNGESLDKINSVRAELFEVFKEITADGARKRKLSKWIEQIYAILERGKVYEKMNEMAAELREEGLIGEAMEYESVYNKVIELFDALCDLMGDEDYSVKELSDILKVGFSEIRVGVLPQKVDSLLVGDMQRTRLKETKELFILGVNDGNIPKGASDSGLLSVPDKEELRKAESRLAPTSVELAFIEQLYIYLNLTKPTDKLYLSFASVGGKGDSLIPSYLIEVLKSMFEGLEVTDNTAKTPGLFLQDIKEETGKLLGLYVTGIANEKQEEKLFENISIIKGSEGGEEWCEKVIANAFREYEAKPLEKETARNLYGDLLTVSISTLERFAACRYAHFVAYGLGLKEREEYGLESVDMGNLSHDVLETVGQKLKAENLDFSTADAEMMSKEIDMAIEHLTGEYNGDLLVSDEKTKYYARQLQRIMKRTVKTLGFQLSKGRYKPEMYEMGFKKMYDLSSPEDDDKKKVILKGRIDRADVYDDANKEYVKIIDYKSSSHKIDEKKLEEGLSLQLAIYMKNAIEMIKERHPQKEVLPAAMLYYAIDDPFSDKRDEYEAEIRKKLIPVGAIVNDDKVLESLDEGLSAAGAKSDVVKVSRNKDNSVSKTSNVCTKEEFDSMLDKAEDKAKELASDILSGSIDINPYYEKKEDNACMYCALKGICGFDPKIKGYEYRKFGETEPEEDEE